MATRKIGFNPNKLKSKLSASGSKGKSSNKDADARFWTISVDEAKNGKATIRLLPSLGDHANELPFVEWEDHNFQGVGGWMHERCLNDIDQECPICAMGYKLYKSGTPEGKEMGGKMNKKTNRVCNILVIDDELKPENNGKVFLYKIPPSIFKIIVGQMEPEDEDISAVAPFDLTEAGADLKIVATQDEKKKIRDYSKTFYRKNAEVNLTEKELDIVLSKQHSLKEFEGGYKTVDEVEERLNKVMSSRKAKTVEDEDETPAVTSSPKAPTTTATTAKTTQQVVDEGLPKTDDLDVDAEIRALLG